MKLTQACIFSHLHEFNAPSDFTRKGAQRILSRYDGEDNGINTEAEFSLETSIKLIASPKHGHHISMVAGISHLYHLSLDVNLTNLTV